MRRADFPSLAPSMRDMTAIETPNRGQANAPAPVALGYARGVHAEALETNANLYTRAQIVLTLDGVIVAAIAAVVVSKPTDLEPMLAAFGAETWFVAGLAGLALLASLIASTMALYSRHRQGRTGAATFGPGDMWFYSRIAKLEGQEPGRFVAVGSEVDVPFETKARLTQVATMAPIMVHRANWLNMAFVATGLTLVLLAFAAADYVVRVAA